MSSPSVFFDEWQDCLRAHYIHVLRTGDSVTEPSLRQVLLQTGLSEAEICELQQAAGVECGDALDFPPDAPLAEAYEEAAYTAQLDAAPDDLAPDIPTEELPPEDFIEDEAAEDDYDEPEMPPDDFRGGQLSLF